MPALAQDRLYLAAALNELENYLLSNEMYMRLERDLPRLSISALLLALKRMEPLGAPGEVQKFICRLEAVKTHWHSAWQAKGLREAHARLTQWKEALGEILTGKEETTYSQQVQGRVMLKLLADEVTLPEEISRNLIALDRALRDQWRVGGFIWELDLSPAFPPSEYWYLYGSVIPLG